jgi:transcriptional regulator with XRE-family HTH domain
MRQITLQAMRQRGFTQTQIAESVGSGKAWVTKFLDGSLRTIKEDALHSIEDLLGISYFSVEKATGQRSPLANKLAALVDTDPAFAKLASALEQGLAEAAQIFFCKSV